MNSAALSIETDDFDTIGGRLSRARDAKNSSLAEVAEQVGVEVKTLKAWECDQDEPRSNRLTMLAGVLGISPSWILFGRGTSPVHETEAENAEIAKRKLDQLKSQRLEINAEIESIEESIS